jgi:DNA invertase Pin-like site-specific DNA recombinase
LYYFQKEKRKENAKRGTIPVCLSCTLSGNIWLNDCKVKYILYCRKSTDEKDKQVLSIEAQIAELSEFAIREKLEIVATFSESRTAKTPGRPIFKEVLKKIESGEADAILSWHPDRLARNSVDGGYLIYLLDTVKLKDLKFPSFWFDNTPQGKFMLNLAFGQSKYYVDNLSENVKRGLRQKIRNGVWPSQAPYGYLNNKLTKSIEVDPEKSKVVKKAFEIFAKDKVSFTDISLLLAKGGIHKRSGKPVGVSQVHKMFTNQFYIGILSYNGEFFEGKHDQFITRQLFNMVKRRLEEKGNSHFKFRDYAFSGLMHCGECGATITAETHTKHYKNGTHQKFVYYRCTKKLKPCSQPYLSEEKMTDQLRGFISLAALPKHWGNDWLKWLERDKVMEQQSADTFLEKYKLDIQTIDGKLNLLLDSYLDGTIDSQTYKSKKNQLFNEKKSIEDKIAKTKSGGSSWLEPMTEFVFCAMRAQKIARPDTACEDLRIFAKNIGSNFFLKDKQLIGEMKKPFASLRARAGARAMYPDESENSLSVTPSCQNTNQTLNMLTELFKRFSDLKTNSQN